jgi:FkbM family methyltransferase
MDSLETSLYLLKNKYGFTPKSILDLGAYHGNWSRRVKSIFPGAEFFMIDAIDYDELKYRNIPYKICVLFSEKTKVPWYEKKNTGDSIFKETTGHFVNTVETWKDTETLDSLFEGKQFDFIKIDCQGAEIPILKGGQELIKNTEIILLEVPFAGQYNKGVPSFQDHISYMKSIGFLPYDIVELHRASDILFQIDVLFVRETSPIWVKIQESICNLGV